MPLPAVASIVLTGVALAVVASLIASPKLRSKVLLIKQWGKQCLAYISNKLTRKQEASHRPSIADLELVGDVHSPMTSHARVGIRNCPFIPHNNLKIISKG